MLRPDEVSWIERFRYVYDYTAYWVCDIRLEATLPVDPKLVYPVYTGGKKASPSENFPNVQAYMKHIDDPRCHLPVEAMLVIADTLKVIVESAHPPALMQGVHWYIVHEPID